MRYACLACGSRRCWARRRRHGVRAAYDLRRLRLRGLIERIPHTRRYRVTDEGFRTALCFHRTYARVLRPSLSVVFDSTVADPTPLQKAVQCFDREIDRLWEGQTIAA